MPKPSEQQSQEGGDKEKVDSACICSSNFLLLLVDYPLSAVS